MRKGQKHRFKGRSGSKCSVRSWCQLHPFERGKCLLVNSRSSSSATLGSWWLELHQIGTEPEAVCVSVFVLLGLLDLSLFLGELLQLLLVLGGSLHLGLGLLLVLLDQLVLLAVLFTHGLQLERHSGGVDKLGAFHEHGEVVTGEGMHLLVEVGVAQCLNELEDNSRGLKPQELLLNGLVRFLQHSELLVGWILENVLDELVENVEASNDLGFIVTREDPV